MEDVSRQLARSLTPDRVIIFKDRASVQRLEAHRIDATLLCSLTNARLPQHADPNTRIRLNRQTVLIAAATVGAFFASRRSGRLVRRSRPLGRRPLTWGITRRANNLEIVAEGLGYAHLLVGDAGKAGGSTTLDATSPVESSYRKLAYWPASNGASDAQGRDGPAADGADLINE